MTIATLPLTTELTRPLYRAPPGHEDVPAEAPDPLVRELVTPLHRGYGEPLPPDSDHDG